MKCNKTSTRHLVAPRSGTAFSLFKHARRRASVLADAASSGLTFQEPIKFSNVAPLTKHKHHEKGCWDAGVKSWDPGSITLFLLPGKKIKPPACRFEKINQLVLNQRESRETFATLRSFFFLPHRLSSCPLGAGYLMCIVPAVKKNKKRKQTIKKTSVANKIDKSEPPCAPARL